MPAALWIGYGDMDTKAFLAALDGAFDGRPELGVPLDPRYAAVADDVTGFTTPAELAVLNLAARMLPEGEAYLEVGTFKGRSLCGALVDAPHRRYVAVENFMEFGMLGAEARRELVGNLERYAGDRNDVRLLEGDCFKLLARPDAVGEPVGVYFYDGAHTGMAHYLALGVVEPLLADEALVLVDDASWPMVARATTAYVEGNAGLGGGPRLRRPRERRPTVGQRPDGPAVHEGPGLGRPQAAHGRRGPPPAPGLRPRSGHRVGLAHSAPLPRPGSGGQAVGAETLTQRRTGRVRSPAPARPVP